MTIPFKVELAQETQLFTISSRDPPTSASLSSWVGRGLIGYAVFEHGARRIGSGVATHVVEERKQKQNSENFFAFSKAYRFGILPK